MNTNLLKISAGVTALALVTSGCENMTPGENAAVFGTAAGAITGIALGASGVDPRITIPVAIGAGALAAGGAYVIAKQQASNRQRKIAEERAKLYYAKLQEQERKAAKVSSTTPKKPVAKKPRYIAVDTVKEDSNVGKKQVMVYDTKTSEIVGNNVYDLKTAPKVGQTTKFDTYTVEYVGTGA